MGFFSALGSAFANAASGLSLHDLTGGWSDMSSREHSAKYNAKLALKYSQAYDMWQALNMPSYTVKGLRDAGLNPILATGQDFGGTINTSMPPAGGDSKIFQGIAKKESQIADATISNINARTDAERVTAHAAMSNAEANQANAAANQENAATNKQNAITNQWQMFDAKSIGAGGFSVQFLGKGFGTGGDFKTIHTLRVNKVTGEAYDALSGERVRVISELPVNSGKTAGEDATRNYYQFNNYYDNMKDQGKFFNLPR